MNSKIPALIEWVRNHKTLPVCFTFRMHNGLSYSTRSLVRLLIAVHRQTLFKRVLLALTTVFGEMEKEFKELMEEYDDTEIIEHFEEKYGESIRV